MRKVVFEALRQRYGFACGYCGITETDTGSLLTVDHFQPRAHGGRDSSSNLVYACHACNEYKGDYFNPVSVDRLLHPLNDLVSSHISLQADGTLTALTDTGRFHIQRLHLNRPPLMAYRFRLAERSRLLSVSEQEQRERGQLVALVTDVVKQLSHLTAAINAMRSGGE